MSTNSTVLSESTLQGASESTLAKNLLNANEFVKKMDIKSGKKEKGKKK